MLPLIIREGQLNLLCISSHSLYFPTSAYLNSYATILDRLNAKRDNEKKEQLDELTHKKCFFESEKFWKLSYPLLGINKRWKYLLRHLCWNTRESSRRSREKKVIVIGPLESNADEIPRILLPAPTTGSPVTRRELPLELANREHDSNYPSNLWNSTWDGKRMNHFRFRCETRNGTRIEWMGVDVSTERSISNEKRRCYLWAGLWRGRLRARWWGNIF